MIHTRIAKTSKYLKKQIFILPLDFHLGILPSFASNIKWIYLTSVSPEIIGKP